MMNAEFLATQQEMRNENRMIIECNKITHKLIVTDYMSGDDRDYWSIKCSKCFGTFRMSSNTYEPDLNYCPFCSPKGELIGENIWNDKEHKFEIEPDTIDKYVYNIWNGYEQTQLIVLARFHAVETTEYKAN